MNRALLISDQVLQGYPALMKICEREGSALLKLSSSLSILDQLLFHEPNVLILSESERGESALVLCEMIRGDSRLDQVKIVITSHQDSNALKIGAKAAGCDLFSTLEELPMVLPTFLSLLWTPEGVVQFDRAPRFEVDSEVEIFLQQESHQALTKNASRSGMFLLSPVAIESGTPLVLRFTAKNGLPIDIQVRVTRTQHFVKAEKGFRYGVALMMEEIDRLNQKKLHTTKTKNPFNFESPDPC